MKPPLQVFLVALSVAGLLIADPIEDLDPEIDIEDIEDSMMEALEGRDPKKELRENIKHKKLVFYCTGSFLNGYSVPGLSQEEVDEFIESKDYKIENQYQTDPLPVFQPDGYYEMIIEFMEIYNKLLLNHIKEEHTKATLTTRTRTA